MRVLMATMQLDIGGAETHIVELSKALSKMGVEVLVASNGGAYVKELEDAGIKHFKVELNRKTPGAVRRSYRQLEKIILENNVDIVHAHARIPGFLCGLLKKKHNFRFVTTAHWVFSTRFPFNLLTNWGDRSLAVSDDIKQYLIDNYGIKGENIKVTINGVDTDKFSKNTDFSDVAREFEFGENKTRIVYVSRMDIDRSFAAHKLIEATPEVLKKVPDLEVVIVGGGNDYEPIRTEAEEMNRKLGQRVIITTGPRTDINKFAAAAQVFVGVSRAALEAMAAEKPAIIAGNEGYIGIFDKDKLQVSIDTNFCCRGCEMTTAEGLVRDLLKLLGEDREEICERLGAYSLETVKKYYSVDTMARDALSMYISIIKDGGFPSDPDKEMEDIEKYLICPKGKRDIDVVLSGYYGFSNSGDESILEAIISHLRGVCPNISITVLSNTPKETAAMYGVNSVDRFDFFALRKLFSRTKLLISGGGSLIQDVTSTKSVLYYLTVIKMAKHYGAKVMLYANGIGPVNKAKNRKAVAKTLKGVDCITLREDSSLAELCAIMGGDTAATVTADPVFGMETCEDGTAEKALAHAGIGKDDKFFVMSVREWNTMDSDAVHKLCEFSKAVYEKYGIKPFIIPMQKTRDRQISMRIFEEINAPWSVYSDGFSPGIMMGIIQRAEFVVGMRLHTLIYAAKAGVPTVALDYDPKVDAVMKYVGINFAQKVENIDAGVLLGYVDEILDRYGEITGQIKKKSEELSALARKNAEMAVELLNRR